jgi:hypothetical protein
MKTVIVTFISFKIDSVTCLTSLHSRVAGKGAEQRGHAHPDFVIIDQRTDVERQPIIITPSPPAHQIFEPSIASAWRIYVVNF